MNRSSQENRRNKYFKEKRKKALICSKLRHANKESIDYSSINKLRFSTPFRKTKNKGDRKRRKYGNYAKNYNPPISDRKKLIKLYFEIEDFLPPNLYNKPKKFSRVWYD